MSNYKVLLKNDNKRFIDYIHFCIERLLVNDDFKSTKEKLEHLAFNILVALDGCTDSVDTGKIQYGDLHDDFYNEKIKRENNNAKL